MVPSSPKVPWSTGKITSTLMARSEARRRCDGVGLEGNKSAVAVDGLGRNDDGLASGEHGGGLGVVSGSPARRLAGARWN